MGFGYKLFDALLHCTVVYSNVVLALVMYVSEDKTGDTYYYSYGDAISVIILFTVFRLIMGQCCFNMGDRHATLAATWFHRLFYIFRVFARIEPLFTLCKDRSEHSKELRIVHSTLESFPIALVLALSLTRALDESSTLSELQNFRYYYMTASLFLNVFLIGWTCTAVEGQNHSWKRLLEMCFAQLDVLTRIFSIAILYVAYSPTSWGFLALIEVFLVRRIWLHFDRHHRCWSRRVMAARAKWLTGVLFSLVDVARARLSDFLSFGESLYMIWLASYHSELHDTFLDSVNVLAVIYSLAVGHFLKFLFGCSLFTLPIPKSVVFQNVTPTVPEETDALLPGKAGQNTVDINKIQLQHDSDYEHHPPIFFCICDYCYERNEPDYFKRLSIDEELDYYHERNGKKRKKKRKRHKRKSKKKGISPGVLSSGLSEDDRHLGFTRPPPVEWYKRCSIWVLFLCISFVIVWCPIAIALEKGYTYVVGPASIGILVGFLALSFDWYKTRPQQIMTSPTSLV